MARAWYAYAGSGPVDSVDSYLYATTGAPSCFAGRRLCAVYATSDPSNPSKPQVISSNLQAYIAAGITNGGPRPLPPNDKPYVYFFPQA